MVYAIFAKAPFRDLLLDPSDILLSVGQYYGSITNPELIFRRYKMTAVQRDQNERNICDPHLLIWAKAFLKDRKAQGLSSGTIEFYEKKLALFTNFCEANSINNILLITPEFIRNYMQFLEEKGCFCQMKNRPL